MEQNQGHRVTSPTVSPCPFSVFGSQPCPRELPQNLEGIDMAESWGNRHGTGQVCVVREKHFPWDFIMYPHGWETPAVDLQFTLSKIPGLRRFLTVGEPKWPPSKGCSAYRQEIPGHGHRCSNYAALWRKGYVTVGQLVSPRLFFDSDIFLVGEKYQLPLLCLPLQIPP